MAGIGGRCVEVGREGRGELGERERVLAPG